MSVKDYFSSPQSQTKEFSVLSKCALTWHDRELFVYATEQDTSFQLAGLSDFNQMVECLKRSPVELVKLDRTIGLLATKKWIEACSLAGKACYVSIDHPIEDSIPLFKWLSLIFQSISKIFGFLSLLLLSPLATLYLMVLSIKGYSINLDREWAYDQRGRVVALFDFKIIDNKSFFSLKIPLTLVKVAEAINVVCGRVNIFITPPRIIDSSIGTEVA